MICSSTLFAQDSSIKIESDLLQKLIKETDSHLLLKFEAGSIYALDSKRNTIYPSGYAALKDEVFYVFEISYLKEVLEYSRKSKILTDDIITLETIGLPWCPPECPNN